MSDVNHDVRVVRHLMRRGELTDAEYAKYLESLPDDAAEAKETDTRFSTPYGDRHYAGRRGER